MLRQQWNGESGKLFHTLDEKLPLTSQKSSQNISLKVEQITMEYVFFPDLGREVASSLISNLFKYPVVTMDNIFRMFYLFELSDMNALVFIPWVFFALPLSYFF